MPDILMDARRKVYGDREAQYGPPTHNFETIAELWRVYFEKKHGILIPLLPDDVCQMQILVKMARLMHDPSHYDSLMDIAGYVAVQHRIDTFDGQMELPIGSAA